MSILIVEDSRSQQRLLSAMLRHAGYTNVLTTNSAEQAFRYLEERQDIDLILMDIELEQIDGITACRRIKAEETCKDIPVIMVTVDSQIEKLTLAFAAGAMDYVLKPPRAAELLVRIRSALKLKHEIDRRKARERELVEVTRQLELSNQQLAELALQDGLTGIANRRHFDAVLEYEWRRALRTGSTLSLLLLDVDHFKAYNDMYGHKAGDLCLCTIAGALRDSLQRAGELVARYGGEEFAVILPNSSPTYAAQTADYLCRRVAALHVPHHGAPASGNVTISIGCAVIAAQPGLQLEDLIQQADRALYAAKQAGRNRVIIASPGLEEV